MGLDLRLLPFDADIEELSFSHTILDCLRRGELFDEILKIEEEHGLAVPDRFASFVGHGKDGEPCYGVTVTTPYGEPLLYTTAASLLTLKDREGVTDNYQNRAIWAYLAELPPATKVALYWH